MKKFAIYFLIFLFFNSCTTVQYDGETRFVVTGTVVDAENNPLPNINISLTNKNSLSGLGSNSNQSGLTKTNKNGEFTLIVPKSTNAIITEIALNANASNGLQSLIYRNLGDKDFEDYKIEMPKVVLNPIENVVDFRIEFVRNGLNKELLQFQIIENNQFHILYKLPFAIFGENNVNQISTNFTIKKNQNLIVQYSVLDKATNAITNLEQNYTIEVESLETTIVF